jgi:exopolysaccharide biosynthesis operon protein EpsL
MRALDPFRLMAGMLMLVSVSNTFGASGDLLTINANVTSMHDDNLFRRPSDGSLGVIASDSSTTTQVGLALRKALSLQVLELSVNITDNKYKEFKTLDSRNDGYSAAWRWQITPHLTGSLSSDRQQSQTDFADFRGAGQNQRTSENRSFNANWNFLGGWTLGAGATATKSINSQPFIQDASNEQRIADVSVKYAFPSGAALSVTSSQSSGDYHRQADPVTLSDSGFFDRRDEAHLDWPITGKTKLNANYGRLSRKHETFSARDYSGNIGSINLSWAATGKTSFSFRRTRSIESWEDAASSFSVRNSTGLSLKWQASPKVALSAALDRDSRNLDGFAIVPAAYARVETTAKESISLNWAALTNLTFAASVQNSRRRSNSPGLDYDDHVMTISASASF